MVHKPSQYSPLFTKAISNGVTKKTNVTSTSM